MKPQLQVRVEQRLLKRTPDFSTNGTKGLSSNIMFGCECKVPNLTIPPYLSDESGFYVKRLWELRKALYKSEKLLLLFLLLTTLSCNCLFGKEK